MSEAAKQSGLAVTIREVAERAGVSPMTVSRVINGGDGVRTSTRQVVERAIADLGYVPNSLARGLSRQATATLALVVPDIANPFFTKIIRGAEEVARQAGQRLIICHSRNDAAVEQVHIQEMLAQRVEGLIIAPVDDTSRRALRALEQRHFPFVLVDRYVDGLHADCVIGDNIGDGRQLAKHLLDVGHRRIAMFVGNGHVSTSRDRLAGYQQALMAAGMTLDPRLVITAGFDVVSGTNAVPKLLALDPQPTALLAVNSFVAVGAIAALRAAGRRVPEDIAVVCFDDIEYAAQLDPFLTVMNQQAESYGTLATQLLLERIEGRAFAPRRVVLNAHLIVRRSCGSGMPDSMTG